MSSFAVSFPIIGFPIAYVIIDSFLVIFIKSTAVDGHTAYNTITINALAEMIKLFIAVYSTYSEGNLHTVRAIVSQPVLLLKFLLPNLMYAFNNNLFHYAVGALPPAVFVVAINAFRTIFTAFLQPCVSHQALTARQIVACALIVFSFVFASMPELIRAGFEGSIQGSVFEQLVYLSTCYSVVSVGASLVQEKLLKDSSSLMAANIVNYSIGFVLQSAAMCYHSYSLPSSDLFRGLDIFWVKLIPCLMALVGLSISFVLKHFDNIVKLICSSLSVLIVNTMVAYLEGDQYLNIYFLAGWILTIPAAYLYHVKAQPQPTPHLPVSHGDVAVEKVAKIAKTVHSADEEAMIHRRHPHVTESTNNVSHDSQDPDQLISKPKGYAKLQLGLGLGVLLIFVYSLMFSSFEVSSLDQTHAVNADQTQYHTCPMFEVAPDAPKSNMRVVSSYSLSYTPQFVVTDQRTGENYVSCLSHLYILGPDSSEARKNGPNDKWHAVPAETLKTINVTSTSAKGHIDESYRSLSWSYVQSLYGDDAPYAWLHCADSHHPDANLLLRPPMKALRLPRLDLTQQQKRDVQSYISGLSQQQGADDKPLFDTVLVLYLDAVSRFKFHSFYKRSLRFLNQLADRNLNISGHTAIELERFHALGINSVSNYPSFFAGNHPHDTKRFFHKNATNSMREPWLFDIAEAMGYDTLGGTTRCYHYCREDCYERFKDHKNYEVGGFFLQYMGESSNRFPGAYNFPTSSYCEGSYRSELKAKVCSTCANSPSDFVTEQWAGNKLAMSYVMDYWRSWLSIGAASGTDKRFGSIVFEETHQQDFYEEFDKELEAFLSDLVLYNSRGTYKTERLAMVIMADHGMHYMPEYRMMVGKVANKQPYGFLILPNDYLRDHPTQASTLMHNSKALVTPLDIRATVQYWLTGRDWGAPALRSTNSELKSKVFASNYGYNLMNSLIESNRTCQMAGIPREFCGCHLFPCENSLKWIVKNAASQIAHHMNDAIAAHSVAAQAVCRPLKVSEVIFTPSLDDCLSSKEVVVVHAWIQRRMRLVSATFTRENGGKKVVLSNLNTVTPYKKIWAECREKLAKLNISEGTIPEEQRQFCHCNDEASTMSNLAGIVHALDFKAF